MYLFVKGNFNCVIRYFTNFTSYHSPKLLISKYANFATGWTRTTDLQITSRRLTTELLRSVVFVFSSY
ncbi:hypothetical protein WDU94_010515 [Cyamophila willieti]